jgi:hypothetical protein
MLTLERPNPFQLILYVYFNIVNTVISSYLFAHRFHVLNAIFLFGVFPLLPGRIWS